MRILKVEQVVRYLHELFDSNAVLQDLWVQGQISNVSKSPQGHHYFTLKDRETQLNCVLFRSAIDLSPVVPINGLAAIVHGRVTIYETRGLFQLVADLIQAEGVGKLHLQFEQLKQRLAKEGLFEQGRKRPLPRWPRCIGLVTSPSGAVIHDIVNVVRRKYPACELLLAPAYVSGDQAVPSIVAALRALNESRLVQMIIVARGGGSVEELWPFNDERVARAIFGSRVPVVSAVGHEKDVTVADLVADVRAPTPSVAAEISVPELAAERRKLQDYAQRLEISMRSQLAQQHERLSGLQAVLEAHSPLARIQHDRERVRGLDATLRSGLRHGLDLQRERVSGLQRQLALMSPYATLERGYAITFDDAGAVVSSVKDVQAGDGLAIRLRDGLVGARATEARAISVRPAVPEGAPAGA